MTTTIKVEPTKAGKMTIEVESTAGWSTFYDGEKSVITLNGKVLKEEAEIIDFIDTYMKPVDLHLLENPELEWEFMRAFMIFKHLFNRDERVDVYAESYATGVNLALIVYPHVMKRYPDLGWRLTGLKKVLSP